MFTPFFGSLSLSHWIAACLDSWTPRPFSAKAWVGRSEHDHSTGL